MTRKTRIQFSAASLVLLMSFMALWCITLDSPVTGWVVSMLQPTPTPKSEPKAKRRVPPLPYIPFTRRLRTYAWYEDGRIEQIYPPPNEEPDLIDMPTPVIDIQLEEEDPGEISARKNTLVPKKEDPGEFSETDATPAPEDEQPFFDQYDMLRIAWSVFGVLCFLTYFPFRQRHRAVT